MSISSLDYRPVLGATNPPSCPSHLNLIKRHFLLNIWEQILRELKTGIYMNLELPATESHFITRKLGSVIVGPLQQDSHYGPDKFYIIYQTTLQRMGIAPGNNTWDPKMPVLYPKQTENERAAKNAGAQFKGHIV